MGAHPTEDTVLAFLEGALDGEQREAAESHFAECDGCRAWIAELGRVMFQDAGESDDPMVGVAFGRYVIEAPLGSGGMGLVYRATDPVLARDVALKLVNADEIDAADRARMLGEARAMAKLRHPNVVTVHDAGVDGDELYIAMELVEGMTLGQWCREHPGRWRDTVEHGVAAARGLAAAHRAGIVHRDIKPDNILVGKDGQARVCDFGLARSLGDGKGKAGTPGFVAPEVEAGGEATPRSDQYSLCVSLLACLRPAQTAGAEVRPRGVSRRIYKALRRGMSEAPEARFADVEALARALAAGISRRRMVFQAAALGAIGAVGAAIMSWPAGSDATSACEEFRGRAATLWNDSTKAKVAAAISGLDVAVADPWGKKLEQRLDGYVKTWVEARTDICKQQARESMARAEAARRVACLESAYSDLAGLIDALGASDPARVRNALDTSFQLPSLSRCTSNAPLHLPAAPPPELADQLRETEHGIGKVSQLKDAGRMVDATELARTLDVKAASLGYGPLRAKTLSTLAGCLARTGDIAGAREKLERAAQIAAQSGAEHERAVALINLITAHAMAGDSDGALDAAKRAAPVVARLKSAPMAAALSEALGATHARLRDTAAAEAAFRRALESWTEVYGGDHPRVARSLMNLGSVVQMTGDLDAAGDYHRRGYEMMVRIFGAGHPETASALGAWGTNLRHGGKPHKAREKFEQVVAIGKGQPRIVVMAQANICDILINTEKLDLAIPACDEALRIAAKLYGENSPQTSWQLLLLGRAHYHREELKIARKFLERAYSLRKDQPDLRRELADAQFYLALTLRELGTDRKRALSLARAARPIYVKTPGREEFLSELDKKFPGAAP